MSRQHGRTNAIWYKPKRIIHRYTVEKIDKFTVRFVSWSLVRTFLTGGTCRFSSSQRETPPGAGRQVQPNFQWFSGVTKSAKTVSAIFCSYTSRPMPVQQMNISKLSKQTNGLKWFPLAVAGTSHVWPSRKPFQNTSRRGTPPGVDRYNPMPMIFRDNQVSKNCICHLFFCSCTSRPMPVHQMNKSKLSKHTNGLKWFPLAVAGTSHV